MWGWSTGHSDLCEGDAVSPI